VWIVFLVSAVWHGVRPIYYLSMGITALYVVSSSSAAYLSSVFLPPPEKRSPYLDKFVYLSAFIITQVIQNYVGGVFSILEFEICMRVMASLYYFGIIGPFLCIVVAQLVRLISRRPSSKSNSTKSKE
jgi:hypothetical protein